MREMPSAVHPAVPTISWSTMSCPIETKFNRSSVQTGHAFIFASYMYSDVCISFNVMWSLSLKWNPELKCLDRNLLSVFFFIYLAID